MSHHIPVFELIVDREFEDRSPELAEELIGEAYGTPELFQSSSANRWFELLAADLADAHFFAEHIAGVNGSARRAE